MGPHLHITLKWRDKNRFLCFRKARRKEREGGEATTSGDSKLYLESAVLERKLPEMDMRILVDLPAGLDYNEWLASHSKRGGWVGVGAFILVFDFFSDGPF